MKILVFNAGSSSQKTRLYELQAPLPAEAPPPIWEASADWSHEPGKTELVIRSASGQEERETLPTSERPAVLKHILHSLSHSSTHSIDQNEEIGVIGHRVVHGGAHYSEPALITPELKATIEHLQVLAPAHNRASLEAIAAAEEVFPQARQIAVFDTAFHRHMPLPAQIYPGPYEWFAQGLRRYGFHGLSHQYCARRAAQLLGRDLTSLRLITCHLGNGCSLAAILGGESIETTMGFTPMEGLMMGTRSGSIDPGLLLYLLRHAGYSADDLDRILNRESGLMGISGLSGDMRIILQARAEGNRRARLAFNTFVHRLRLQIGAMLAVLGGIDALVFTGGIGEHAPEVRAAACETLGFLGLAIDPSRNADPGGDADIASPHSAVRVLVVQTQEDWMIAEACWRLIKQRAQT
ncbi:MAG: acetate kinase [Thermogemmatispora sp.]|uniref:acetate/propionate family kinase n=1 Tax=Thermogemmatispora sp. TaxID=1968838 RepID=UPI002626FC4B|nr:acetate kinase [Thermogemmatispora sp.]MBX5457131.1 acetate kinase [Thermogemmatispora sp.]